MTVSDGFPALCREIDRLVKQTKRAAAIDGGSAAGKSFLAARLRDAYACNVISMDDFFLRPFQRTPERLGEPGGNIDYERFEEEILKPLKRGKPFAYRPYNCQTGELAAPVAVTPAPLTIIEGVYSLHPRFTGAYDVAVFLRIGEAEQRRRLAERSPRLYDRFIGEWIPMENQYFNAFEIAGKCDFVFDAGGLA
ncbi:MAG: uridine kinase [Oscillospiraceae bacterium]|nr:uridine kinase [Oscillospiraceae bacterium]